MPCLLLQPMLVVAQPSDPAPGPPATQTAATAADPRDETLTLDRVMDQVVVAHPSVMAARIRAFASGLGKQAAEYGLYPSVQSDMARGGGGAQNSLLRLTQPVYSFGRLSSAIDAAGAREQVALFQIGEAIVQVQVSLIEIMEPLGDRIYRATF